VGVDLGPLNQATYLAEAAGARMLARELHEARRLAGLPGPSRHTRAQATLVAVSPHLLPRPDDWPADVHLTAAWEQQGPLRPDPEVRAFLDAGPFLYAGFGSMASGDPRRRAATVLAAARARGLSVLAVSGWGGLEVPAALRGDDLLVVDAVPHDAVLVHATAAIHHGGSGTVHAAARAGTVAVVEPFLGDQPFWGRLLHRDGVGPAPIPRGRLSTRRLGQALDEVARYRAPLRRLAAELREERGAAQALAVLETLV